MELAGYKYRHVGWRRRMGRRGRHGRQGPQGGQVAVVVVSCLVVDV